VGSDGFDKLQARRPDGSPNAREDSAILASLHDGAAHHVRGGEAFWKRDGSPLLVEYLAMPLRPEPGRATEAIVVFRPEEKGTRRPREPFGLDPQAIVELYERSTDAFFALDRDWRIVYLNPVATAMIPPQNRARRVGEKLWDAFPDLKDSPFDKEYHRAMQEQVDVHVEAYFARMGRWFAADAFPTPQGMSIAFRDVSGRKRSEEAARADRVERSLVRRLLQDLLEAGNVPRSTLQQVGKGLAADTPATDLEGFVQGYAAMGLGSLHLDRKEEGRFSFVGADLVEQRPGGRVATCYFTLGYLSEAAARVTGEPTLGTEIECQSRGSPRCRFIVQTKKTEEGLAHRVKELV
jgi:predicted hydrocarbon binding protein/PAS domain-containing protein